MILRRLFHERLAQSSYLIACDTTRLAVVVDPLRDAERYLEHARREDLRIAFVTETHLHADFVSGAEALARRAGARLLLSAEGATEPGGAAVERRIQRTGALPLHDGDSVMVGRIRLDVRHTPGHTPEHLSFLVTDTASSEVPMGLLTGDFLFVGDVGRPDLLERAVGVQGSMQRSAAALFDSLQSLRRLPDYLQVWPGHGAGSACGKSLSEVPQSTLGYELQVNWAFGCTERAAFVKEVLADQPEPPAYFARMKAINAEGGLPAPPHHDLDADSLRDAIERGASIVDTRPFDRFAAGHLPGSLNLPPGRSFLEWAGSVGDPERELVLLATTPDRETAAEAARDLSLIAFDRVLGVLVADEPAALTSTRLRTVARVPVRSVSDPEFAMTAVDVRSDAEWRGGHLPGAVHVPLNSLVERLDELRSLGPLAVYCRSGSRSSVAASVLLAAGIPDVADLEGGYAEWERTIGGARGAGR